MKEYRSGSQILFGFLPEQTVDLQGRIWKVDEWRHPRSVGLDDTVLRQELVKHAGAWGAAKLDGGYVQDLIRGRPLRVVSLDKENGVRVEPFPNVFMCRSCKRVPKRDQTTCKCGEKRFGQLPFVGYHDRCGALGEPWIPRCKEHDDVEIVLPGTSSASEIVFRCPTCKKTLRKGFGFPNCDCGQGQLSFNVHRAASVYTPRTVVVVNPPSPEKVRRLTQAGGPERALAWVAEGLETARAEELGNTRESLLAQLISSGLSAALAEQMVLRAEEAGELRGSGGSLVLPGDRKHAAEQEAVTIAMALSESRVRLSQLAAAAPPGGERARLYTEAYPAAIERAGLEAVELVDKFPVLTGNFGYTRGSAKPGESRLVPFRNRRAEYVVYSEVGETEALFVRLQPERVARWLRTRDHALDDWADARSARLSILRAVVLPSQPLDASGNEAGEDLLTLVHSYSHRFMRLAATHAGIERSSLSELIVPLHLGFFVYAAARGDFVLGGLQAVFETELDRLLAEIRDGEHRCPLDPGCQRAGGACMACLHVGEPSCRHFNRALNRDSLTSVNGFFSLP
jgi:hypothetical protein